MRAAIINLLFIVVQVYLTDFLTNHHTKFIISEEIRYFCFPYPFLFLHVLYSAFHLSFDLYVSCMVCFHLVWQQSSLLFFSTNLVYFNNCILYLDYIIKNYSEGTIIFSPKQLCLNCATKYDLIHTAMNTDFSNVFTHCFWW